MNTFVLKNIIDQHMAEMASCALYEDKCLVVMPVTNEMIGRDRGMAYAPMRMDSMAIILVEEGEMDVLYDTNLVTIKPGTLVGFRPGGYVEVKHVSDKCQSSVIVLDKTVLDKLNVTIQKIIPYIDDLKNLHGIQLDAEQLLFFRNVFHALWLRIKMDSTNEYYRESVESLITTMVYGMLSLASQHARQSEKPLLKPSKNNRDEYYFRTFMKLVQQYYRRERKISFYAAQMCMSPKYLSGVIRKFSGKGPAEWIDECVMTDARNMLKYSTKSIQEVAIALNFPTQSFFGRYFKAHEGCSPKVYRSM